MAGRVRRLKVSGSGVRTACAALAALGVVAACVPHVPLADFRGSLAANEELVTVESRKGVTTRVLVTKPASAPKGLFLYFPGGEGFLVNASDGVYSAFRRELAGTGYVVGVVDVPSDQSRGLEGLNGYLELFRVSADHTRDGRAVLDAGRCRSTSWATAWERSPLRTWRRRSATGVSRVSSSWAARPSVVRRHRGSPCRARISTGSRCRWSSPIIGTTDAAGPRSRRRHDIRSSSAPARASDSSRSSAGRLRNRRTPASAGTITASPGFGARSWTPSCGGSAVRTSAVSVIELAGMTRTHGSWPRSRRRRTSPSFVDFAAGRTVSLDEMKRRALPKSIRAEVRDSGADRGARRTRGSGCQRVGRACKRRLPRFVTAYPGGGR